MAETSSMTPSPPIPSTPRPSFLTLPPELRLRIYAHLPFTYTLIRITQSAPSHDYLPPSAPTMSRIPTLSASLILTSRLIHSEAQPLLYSTNIFDCSQREATKLLLNAIGPANFKLIQHIVLDWEQLQEFAWSLSKPDFVDLTVNLRTLDLATWRARVLGGSSFLWREVKFYERSLCLAALDITRKHPRLRVVLQRGYFRSSVRKTTVDIGRSGSSGGGTAVRNETGNVSSTRVKWRIVAEDEVSRDGETVVKILEELDKLKSKDGEEEGAASTLMGSIDAF